MNILNLGDTTHRDTAQSHKIHNGEITLGNISSELIQVKPLGCSYYTQLF